jgi:hypothetical protein
MQRRLVVPLIVLIAPLLSSPLGHAQARLPGAVYDFDKKGEKPGPAPKRDLSGIWEPASGPSGGIQGKGAAAMESCKRDKPGGKYSVDPKAPVTDTGYATPDCLKPDIEPPYTALGRETVKAHIPVEGYRMVPDSLTNDPILKCDPGGFPRINLHNFRTSEILQTPTHVVILYKFQHRWRQIWTDGRELPKDPENPSWGNSADALPAESRWWGYSVGKWIDDYTFVVQTNGFYNDRTWLDNAGLPQSDAMQVEETYHRVDAEHLELSIKITDPKMYTKPWLALDKLPLRLQSPHLEIQEMECSPSDQEHWNKYFGNQTGTSSGPDKAK